MISSAATHNSSAANAQNTALLRQAMLQHHLPLCQTRLNLTQSHPIGSGQHHYICSDFHLHFDDSVRRSIAVWSKIFQSLRTLDSTEIEDASAAASTTTESKPRLTATRSASSDRWITMYSITFDRPQIVYSTPMCQLMLAARQCHLQASGLSTLISNVRSSSAFFRLQSQSQRFTQLVSGRQILWFSKRMDCTFFSACALLCPGDEGSDIQWLSPQQLDAIDSGPYERRTGFWRRILEPCTIKFSHLEQCSIDDELQAMGLFVIDSDLGIVSDVTKSSSNTADPSSFTSTASSSPRVLAEEIGVNVHSLIAHLSSEEFWSLVDMLQTLLVTPLQQRRLKRTVVSSGVEIPSDLLRGLVDLHLGDSSAFAAAALAQLPNTNSIPPFRENQQVQRKLIYNVEGASWSLNDAREQSMMLATLSNLHGEHTVQVDGSQIVHFFIDAIRLFSNENPLLSPQQHRWSQRDHRNEHQLAVRLRSLPNLGNLDARLAHVAVYEHLEISLFPLNLDFNPSHYPVLKSYFLPSAPSHQPTSLLMSSPPSTAANSATGSGGSNSLVVPLSPQSAPSGQRWQNPPLSPSSASTAASAIPAPKSAQSQLYLRYFRLNQLDFCITFSSDWINLQQVDVTIAAYAQQKAFGNPSFHMARLEKYFVRKLLGQAGKLVRGKSQHHESPEDEELSVSDVRNMLGLTK